MLPGAERVGMLEVCLSAGAYPFFSDKWPKTHHAHRRGRLGREESCEGQKKDDKRRQDNPVEDGWEVDCWL